MKTIFRRIIAVLAIVAVSGLAAAGLEKFVPGDSELLAVLDVKPVAGHQELARLLNSEKGRKTHELWKGISGLDLRRDIEKICLFGNKDQEGGVFFKIVNSAELLRRMESDAFPKQLAAVAKTYGEEIAFSRMVKNGRVLYVFDNDDSGKIAATLVDPSGVWLVARFEHIETVLTSPRLSGKNMAEMKRYLPDDSYFLRVVWINRSYGKGKKSGIQDDFKVAAAGFKTGGKNNLDQYYFLRLVCSSQEQAFMQSMMISGYLQIGAGMVFSKQPQLAEELSKGFGQKVEKNSVIFTLHVPEKLYAALCGVAVDAAREVLVAPDPVPADIQSGKK